MADSVWIPASTAAEPVAKAPSRRSALVRVTHWITTLCFLALLLSGIEILISHPRFYWGETGNVLTTPLFQIPIPASRSAVPTGYSYVVKDQNGWSRALHFESAWFLVLTGLLYGISGFVSGYFRQNLFAARAGGWSYNPLQRLTYVVVVFFVFPAIVWTGLAMSPAIASVIPSAVTVWGGQQSARTIHFFLTVFLVLFLLVHVAKVYQAGFKARMRSMITGEHYE